MSDFEYKKDKFYGSNTREKIMIDLSTVAPDYSELVADFSVAKFHDRPHLNKRTREFLKIALCVSIGTLAQAKAHIETSLASGATKEEISEVILQTIPIIGFPLATNGLLVLKEVLDEINIKNAAD
jgi:alkylhydroperoxidase/carboxymuconolactone decarboxylase family protein YurZ